MAQVKMKLRLSYFMDDYEHDIFVRAEIVETGKSGYLELGRFTSEQEAALWENRGNYVYLELPEEWLSEQAPRGKD